MSVLYVELYVDDFIKFAAFVVSVVEFGTPSVYKTIFLCTFLVPVEPVKLLYELNKPKSIAVVPPDCILPLIVLIMVV